MVPIRPGDIFLLRDSPNFVLLVVAQDLEPEEQLKEDREFLCMVLYDYQGRFNSHDERAFTKHDPKVRQRFIQDLLQPIPLPKSEAEYRWLDSCDYVTEDSEEEGVPDYIEISYHHFDLNQPEFNFKETALPVRHPEHYMRLLDSMLATYRMTDKEYAILKEALPLFTSSFDSTTPPQLFL